MNTYDKMTELEEEMKQSNSDVTKPNKQKRRITIEIKFWKCVIPQNNKKITVYGQTIKKYSLFIIQFRVHNTESTKHTKIGFIEVRSLKTSTMNKVDKFCISIKNNRRQTVRNFLEQQL